MPRWLPPRRRRIAPLAVTADQLDTAPDELLDTRNAMTRVLLGGQRSAVADVDVDVDVGDQNSPAPRSAVPQPGIAPR